MHNLASSCLDKTLALTGFRLTAIGQHHSGRHLTVLWLISDVNDAFPDCKQ